MVGPPFAGAGDDAELKLLDCLTSCSVIAAATGFAPDDGLPCRVEPLPDGVDGIDDIDGGGNDGSSFADSLTSAAVSGVSDFVAEGAAAAWRSRPSRLRGARCVTCAGAGAGAACCTDWAAGGGDGEVESCASTVTTVTLGGGALGFVTG